ncbi:MAG: GNAT family N-acetyltransferase [Phycisphaeraceae bacterium]
MEIKWGGLDLLDDFYGVFAVNMRDLGTPVYPRQLFAQVLDQFADEAELAVVRHAGRPIAGAILVHGGGSTQVPSASSLRRFNHTNANMWMYYRLLVRAIERGSRAFDFGRSSVGSGTYRFKKQWGATERPTVWQYHERRGCAGDVRPDSPRYRRCIDIWQRLPVWVTRMVGPAIVRGIP